MANDISPQMLKELLGMSYAPNDEQSAVIDMSREGVHLVLAGAGSGKTETMSMRALWMIATQGVQPDQVLGLTFTRKAARELAERFRRYIAMMIQRRDAFAAAGIDLSHLGTDPHGFAVPTVSTYNSFAAQIFSDNAARIGWDSDTPVITEATAYAIARAVVMESSDEHLADIDESLDAIVSAVMRLSNEMAEFGVHDVESVVAIGKNFEALSKLGFSTASAPAVQKKLQKVAALQSLAPLAVKYSEAKRSRGVEFADQVTFARQIIDRFPDVRDDYRSRYSVVILDEYQDTSFAQTRLFTELFGPSRVTAVGDPNQSIYGWRGASPANVASFYDDFGLSAAKPKTLLTTFRNGHKILAAANVILDNRSTKLPLDVPALKAGPTASDFAIDATFAPTSQIEAQRVAAWFKRLIETAPQGKDGKRDIPTLAMLVEKRTHLSDFLVELDNAGVKYHVLGVAGILANPFTADLYCALSVIADPTAGARLVRLLGGSRWRVSVDDLWALHGHARNLAKNYTDAEVRRRLGGSLTPDESDSLIDALDDLCARPRGEIERDESRGMSRVKFSDDGWARLRSAADFFAELRSHVDLSIPDMVSVTASRLGLDVESRAVRTNNPAAHREAFNDLVQSYLVTPGNPSLRGFVDWVSEVERKEKNSPRTEDPEPGTVQILTVHTSKGLEWDAVALPMWTRARDSATSTIFRGDLSDKANELGWLQLGALPRALRGDNKYLPEFDIDGATDLNELEKRSARYTELLKTQIYIPEERRLMYVAVTRARHHLHISGSWWVGTNKKNVVPSDYFTELMAGTDAQGAPLISPSVVDPMPLENPNSEGGTVVWPRDPLGSPENRARYEAAAALVASATGTLDGWWLESIDHLTADRTSVAAEVPVRIPASRYAEWAMDVSKVKEGNRRPVPSRPYRAARIGTEMHLWIEQGNYDEGPLDGLDIDAIDNDVDIEQLKANFIASRWHGLTPEHREIEILLPQGRHIVVCKIDAVFSIDGRWTVVDWKTGAKPETEEERDAKAMQLVLYRRAFAAWKGIPAEDIDCVLYYVKHDHEWVIEPERLARLDALPIID